MENQKSTLEKLIASLNAAKKRGEQNQPASGNEGSSQETPQDKGNLPANIKPLPLYNPDEKGKSR